ncbi:MAG: FAD-binding oxidoreductase [Oceanospirillaceae bacterium]|nr:FAD-binding oxidoreductase [Oceanospirillaceae bacterium]
MSSKQFLEDPAVNFVDFLNALDDVGFEGEISPHQADRIIASTDNSVYQLLPQGVLYPKHEADLQAIFKLAAQSRFKSIYFAPRGGGTGTNGQSLTDGLVVDCSRHLNAIVDVDIEAGWVKVQAGVIRDQLNDFLRPHGMFFAPTLSTSNRATLGGMANTDACGQGSRIYGRTSNHVLSLNLILANGQQVATKAMTPQGLQHAIDKGGPVAHLYRQVNDLVEQKQDAISARFPKLNRFMTGYNLAHIKTDNGFDLSRLICGSEGTLAVVSELTLKLTPIPLAKQLLVLGYDSFDGALRDATQLVLQNPDAIETIDDTILTMAQDDVIWHQVKDYIAFPDAEPIAAINLVEFGGMDAGLLAQKIDAVCAQLTQLGMRHSRVSDPKGMASLWELRKKGVGLLGNLPGKRRPIAFVEDTAVPPENLADYIVEFRQLLDGMGVSYGMFGHVDAGCLHVRPALNMRDPEDALKLKLISDAVQALVQKYEGVMWGEHGKGFRSEYTQETIGVDLYADMRRIKGWFDPHNQLNPSKICTPASVDSELVKVDDPRTRGAADRQLGESMVEQWQPVVACNGNGACFNYQPQAAMCPSYKATKDRVQSPKGRASLLREWLRQEATGGADSALETQVYQSLQSCLACKACTTACPIKVDIPTYRSRFLQRYFAKRRRPLSDYAVALVESLAMVTSKVSRLSNWGMQLGASRWLIKNLFGMVNLPKIHPYKLSQLTAIDGVEAWHPHQFENLTDAQKRRSVVIVQDVFSSCYDLPQVQGILSCLVKMGFTPIVMPLKASAKPLYVKGFLTAFEKQAAAVTQQLQLVQQQGLTLVAVDPSVGLTYGDEYRQLLGPEAVPDVLLLQQWLHQVEGLIKLPTVSVTPDMAPTLLGHCSETALVVQSTAQWVGLFAKFGIALNTPDTGCCGMAGTFGHEQKHQALAAKLYTMSWQQPVNAAQGAVLATGYSCRSQITLRSDQQPLHPLNYLNRCLEEVQGSGLN